MITDKQMQRLEGVARWLKVEARRYQNSEYIKHADAITAALAELTAARAEIERLNGLVELHEQRDATTDDEAARTLAKLEATT